MINDYRVVWIDSDGEQNGSSYSDPLKAVLHFAEDIQSLEKDVKEVYFIYPDEQKTPLKGNKFITFAEIWSDNKGRSSVTFYVNTSYKHIRKTFTDALNSCKNSTKRYFTSCTIVDMTCQKVILQFPEKKEEKEGFSVIATRLDKLIAGRYYSDATSAVLSFAEELSSLGTKNERVCFIQNVNSIIVGDNNITYAAICTNDKGAEVVHFIFGLNLSQMKEHMSLFLEGCKLIDIKNRKVVL